MIVKLKAIESLGAHSLALPGLLKPALAANDRLKVCFSALQAGVRRAQAPDEPPIDLSRERAAAGLAAAWLDEVLLATSYDGARCQCAAFGALWASIGNDLQAMARPLDGDPALAGRVQHWSAWLKGQEPESIDPDSVRLIVHGNRGMGDSVHLLVMDLHRALNRLAAQLAEEVIDGAHAVAIEPADRPRIAAFMRGLALTRHLKFEHPGLDTAATRDGERLLIQNDIGTNDAHVLVLQVVRLQATLTYSDLHRPRFEFFQQLLSDLGAQWSTVEPRLTPGLNEGESYFVGTAVFDLPDEAALLQALEGIGSRIVFLIDWNRARKRLQEFVGKREAVAILLKAARSRVGHMAWLVAGGERLLYGAMQDAGAGLFRFGERLEDVLGAAAARELLSEALAVCAQAMIARQPASRIRDEVRVLFSRHAHGRSAQFDLLSDHAAYAHALAQSLFDALSGAASPDVAPGLAARAKRWERRADELVMQARSAAESQARWREFAPLVARADDAVDALEEAAFLYGVIAEDHPQALDGDVRACIGQIAQTVLACARDQMRSVVIAQSIWSEPDAVEVREFLDVSWRIELAERRADEQLRTARRAVLRRPLAAAGILLATDLAAGLEAASDHVLAANYALRDMVIARTETV